jgi:ubiquinone/menaquinone biosynthesis C-methylase UbiE/uncharacterized protein YbaR (Trm112 family)
MREGLLPALRCPRCRAGGALALVEAGARDDGEVRAGALRCGSCGQGAAIAEGIVDLLVDPPDFVAREAAGLERFAEMMANDGWDRERVLALPEGEHQGYWYGQSLGIHQALESIDPRPGARLLDIGSNTCWASATFASHGLEVVALDIATTLMQGLRTADWWFEARDIHFERVLGMMFDLPFADASFDYVWCCEVLHHNHHANLVRTVREAHRVLRPGGRLLVVNEPQRSLRKPMLRPGHEVAMFQGHEHAYLRATYLRALRGAGFAIELDGSIAHGMFNPATFEITFETPVGQAVRMALAHIGRRSRPVARLAEAVRAYL